MPVSLVPKKKTRKQNYQTCPWCVKRNIVPPHQGARVGPFRKHCNACEAQYLMETEATSGIPSLRVVYEMLVSARKEIAELQAWKARVEQNRKDREDQAEKRVNTLSAKECWARRRQHIQQIRHVFGQRKFDLFFDPNNIHCADILVAVLVPALEIRDDKLCLKGIATTDIYHIAKHIWSKNSTDVNLLWYHEECTKMDVALDLEKFDDANDLLEMMYHRFKNTFSRAGSDAVPQGLVKLNRIWNAMKKCFEGFEDEIWDADGTIIDRVPPPELLQNAAGQ